MKKILLLILALLLLSCTSSRKSMSDFNLNQLKSNVDFDLDGLDDYSDFLSGAKKDAQNKPRYDGSYVDGGYPSDDVGVCTDVIWRAFKEAGYDLKAMIDQDIMTFPQDYPHITTPDPNIDFRRVTNQHIFFSKYAQILTNDINDLEAWQPGDIVVFNQLEHIGMISDYRNEKGHAYVLHNSGQNERDQDYLSRSSIVAHYRFDASLIDSNILIEVKK